MKLDSTFVYANYAEAALWAGIGGAVLLKRRDRIGLLIAAALLIFGLSDIVETRTGAWYRPWWLLGVKVACVMTIAGLMLLLLRRGRDRDPPDPRF